MPVRSTTARPSRFFDAETGGELRLRLQRDGAAFLVLRQLGYRDRHHPEPFVIPADTAHFRTDLASIPWFFAWLVPGLGSHLPAVLEEMATTEPGSGYRMTP